MASTFTAQFGGQGAETMLQELRWMVHCAPHPDFEQFVNPLLESVHLEFQNFLEEEPESFRTLYSIRIGTDSQVIDFDPVSWVQLSNEGEESRRQPNFASNPFSNTTASLPDSYFKFTPPNSYLSRACVSFPLIGITQLVRFYYIALTLNPSQSKQDSNENQTKEYEDTFSQLRDTFRCLIGHSQGIVAATTVALSCNYHEFLHISKQMSRLLFWIGVRAQQAFVYTVQGNSTVQSSFGPVGPMIAVLKLPISLVESAISRTNALLEQRSRNTASTIAQLTLGLVNGPRACVVVGTLRAIKIFVDEVLPTIGVPSHQQLEQSRIPFSLRKPEYSISPVSSTVPFHSPLLTSAVEKV